MMGLLVLEVEFVVLAEEVHAPERVQSDSRLRPFDAKPRSVPSPESPKGPKI